AAPVNGLLVSLSSDNPGAFTFPATVTIPQGATTLTFQISGNTAGASANFTASALSFTSATITVQVTATPSTIGLHFVAGQPFFPVAPGPAPRPAGAPRFAQAHWNNGPGAPASANNLVDSTGLATPVNASWTATDPWQALTSAALNDDAQLMNGYLDNSSAVT